MRYTLPLLALGLLTACRSTPPERAKAAALHLLRRELGPAAKLVPDSLKAYEFIRERVTYYTSDIPTFGDGQLVTFPRAAGRGAIYVADNDSAFFFLPSRHAAEFTRQYGVRGPASSQ